MGRTKAEKDGRRKHPRYALDGVMVEGRRLGGPVERLRARNVSRGGMLLEGDGARWPVGAKLEVGLLEDESGSWAPGEVVHSRRADAGATFGVRLAACEVTEAVVSLLLREINSPELPVLFTTLGSLLQARAISGLDLRALFPDPALVEIGHGVGSGDLDEDPDLPHRNIHALKTVPSGNATWRSITIGRSSLCDIVIEHPSLSRCHAAIEFDPVLWRYHLHDRQSRNGSRVEGRRLHPATPHPLQSGNVVELGELRLRFLLPGHLTRFLSKAHWAPATRAFMEVKS